MRLKDVAFVNLRTLDESTKGDYKFRYIDISSVSADNGITLGDEITFQEAPSRARRIVKKDDVLVSTVRTYLRAIANIDWDAKDIIASTGFAVYTPNNKIIPRFLAYSIKSTKAINQICSNSKGVSYPAIQAQVLSSIEIPYWDLKRQEAIAAYLDKECEKIGRKIELLESKADAYSRLRRSLINRAVTRGLDPNKTFKTSQSSICTEIPSHWQEKRIKDIFTEKSIKGYPNEPMLCATQSKGVIPQSLYENRVVTAVSGLENMKLVDVGNFVISLRSFQGGIEYAYYRGIISAAYTILELDTNNSHDYFRHFFKSLSLIKLMKKCVTGIRDGQNINYTTLKYEHIPVPPIEEQKEIAAYLDEKCAKIDAILEKINTEVERLTELKRSLINEVVTGQRAIDTESRS